MKTKQNSEPAIQSSAAGRRRVIIIAAAIVAAVLAVAIGIIVRSSNPVRHLRTQLDLGDRYLSELDYERAIAMFEGALRIDPRSVAAYEGLARTYGNTEDYASVADVYVRASGSLDALELAVLSDSITDMALADLEALVQAGRYDEALQIVSILSAVMENDRLTEYAARVQERILADHVLVWERALYRLIMEEGYLGGEEKYYFGTYGDFDLPCEPVAFALRDLDISADGIPEASVFNGHPGYMDGRNYLYRLAGDEYRYIEMIHSSSYNVHVVSDHPAYPGIFELYGHYGWASAAYVFVNTNGELSGDTIATYEIEAGDAEYIETEIHRETEDDALYAEYQRIGGLRWGKKRSNELKYYTLEEIRAMGWEAFMEAYGFTSFLFTGYASGQVKQEREMVPDDATQEQITGISEEEKMSVMPEKAEIVEEIAIDKELQRDLNVFLCNFTETNDAEIGIGFYQFDSDNYDVTQLMDFAFLWTNINQPQNMKTYPDRDFLHYGITLRQINYAIERYFGFTITEQQARGYANTSEYRYYRDSVLHWKWGNGSNFTEAAIVDRASRLKDGTLFLEFTGYLIYWGEEEEYYSLTPSQAASRNAADQSLWENRYHGTAIAKPYEENGKTRYKLLKYTTDQQ